MNKNRNGVSTEGMEGSSSEKRSNVTQSQLDKVVAAVGGSDRVQDIYPLSGLQQGLVFHSALAHGADAYVTTMCGTLIGSVDAILYRRAWQMLVDRHTAFRTVFVTEESDTALQVVLR